MARSPHEGFARRAVVAGASAIALILGSAQTASAARGAVPVVEPPPDSPAGQDMNRRERRDGVVLGLMGGFGVAGASGYPNASSKIDNPDYYSSSDLLGGSGGSFFVMGALADYLNFGFWAGGGTFTSGDWRSTGGGGGIRVEVFPLYRLVPGLRDLGVMAQFGIGGTKLEAKHGRYPAADGVQSLVGTGVFYEFNLFKGLGGHFVAGPSLEYEAIFSPSIEQHWALLGGRVAFYGGM